jgi:hypothetical protein
MKKLTITQRILIQIILQKVAGFNSSGFSAMKKSTENHSGSHTLH